MEPIQVEAEVVHPSDQKPWLWKPGQSGNPKGRPPKGKAFADVIDQALESIHPIEAELAARQGRTPRKSIEVIVEKMILKAMTGDANAVAWLAMRRDGKPVALHQHEGQVDVVHGPSTQMSDVLAKLQEIRDRKAIE